MGELPDIIKNLQARAALAFWRLTHLSALFPPFFYFI
jgi:hypothetical protein